MGRRIHEALKWWWPQFDPSFPPHPMSIRYPTDSYVRLSDPYVSDETFRWVSAPNNWGEYLQDSSFQKCGCVW